MEPRLNYLFPAHTRAFETAEERLAASRLPVSERQAMIENMVFEYPDFKTIVANINLFHSPVDAGHAAVGHVGGLLGESRTGKSEIINSFRRQHMPTNPTGQQWLYPVAYVACSDRMSKVTLAKDIYTATNASSVPTRMPLDTAKLFARRRVEKTGVRFLILDDAQMIFENRRDNTSGILGVLKELLDLKLCQVLLVGTEDVDGGLQEFIHMYRRGDFPVQYMPTYKKDSVDAMLKYVGFLMGVSKLLPFELESGLGRPSYRQHFIAQTGGLRGSTGTLIMEAGRKALNDGSMCVRAEHLHRACLDRVRPGQTFVPFTGVSE